MVYFNNETLQLDLAFASLFWLIFYVYCKFIVIICHGVSTLMQLQEKQYPGVSDGLLLQK